MVTMSEINDSGRCAIFTKYLGPTNRRAGRIKAWAKSGGTLSVTRAYEHELSLSQNHAAAAIALCDKLGWTFDTLHQAHTADGCVFVMARG